MRSRLALSRKTLVSLVLGLGCFASLAAATPLILQEGGELSRPRIDVISADDSGVRFTFDLPALEVQTYDLDGTLYQTVTFPGSELQGANGEPCLPAFTRYVAIPAASGAQVNIVSAEEQTLAGYRLLPMQAEENETFAIDRELYGRDAFLALEARSVVAGNPSVLRGLRVVPITFTPVSYNPATGELRAAHHIEVSVDFGGEDLRNQLPREVPLTPAFDRLYRSMVLNYDTGEQSAPASVAPHQGTYLVISKPNPDWVNRLEPLLEWRRRMGYNVVHVTTDDIGSTSSSGIRDWILDAYETWDYPPDYITIVGDASGGETIPTFYDPYSGGEGDHPYTQLAGDDLAPDAFIGRLSADTALRLSLIVHKITSYEHSPYLDDPDWFTRATLVGDTNPSGPTCQQIQEWVREKLVELGYTDIDEIYGGYLDDDDILDSIDRGLTYFGYRGYYNMSGVSASEIAAVTNGPMMCFGLNLTCDTGSFAHGASRSEAWLRAGITGENPVPTGGIGSIGTATIYTATRFNNCFYGGTAYGLFWEGHYQLGPAHARGKMEIISCYEAYYYNNAVRYCYWNTLIGDPATEMWTGYPEPLSVYYPATVPRGANVVTIDVRDGAAQPVEGAWVYLYREDAPGEDPLIPVGGYTGADGQVQLPIDTGTDGAVLVTVTGHNLYPHRGSFEVGQVTSYVGLQSYAVDDDDGNADEIPNPGERIGIWPYLFNYGTQVAADVELTASLDDPYVALLDGGPLSYGNISPGELATADGAIRIRVHETCPIGHPIALDLDITSGVNHWVAVLNLEVAGADLVYDGHELGDVGTRLDPGESGTLTITLRNDGNYAASGPIAATLISDSYAVQVTDYEATYPGISAGGTGSNESNPFAISSPSDCLPGQMAHLRLSLRFADGVYDTASLVMQVGIADSDDPTGPDDYGYLAYDVTDTGYPEAPVFDWVDINPNSGGPGTSCGLSDFGSGQDDTRQFALPFDFTFYGETFDVVSICSNGWLAMGDTDLENYRNWYLPSAGGPRNMIAPFWDNLKQSGDGIVCHWYDEANHRYIVAWDNVKNQYNGTYEAFEVILYDPMWYPTVTGDGVFVYQYELMSNSDSQQMYATAGIQDREHTTGITYSYYSVEPPTAAFFDAGLAIKFTTGGPGAADAHSEPSEPLRLLLGQSEPNPMSRGTTIRFQLDRQRPVTLRIYDVDGHLVRTLRDGSTAAGQHSVPWTGLDDRGLQVPSGVYFYKLDAEDQSIEKKLMLIR